MSASFQVRADIVLRKIERVNSRLDSIELSIKMKEALRKLTFTEQRIAGLDWDESQHPRGQPENKGEFAKKGTVTTGEGQVGPVPETAPSASYGSAPPPTNTHGSGMSPGPQYSPGAHIDNTGAVHAADVQDAVIALYENAQRKRLDPTYSRKVYLTQVREVATLMDKLREVAQLAIVNGGKDEEGKDMVLDLCEVAVEGTNLFCAESKGIPRYKMPQFKKAKEGEQDPTVAFVESMKVKYGVTEEEELVDHLRATQNELNGGKVAGIAGALRAGKIAPARLVVSDDGYIMDGHHRWAALVGNDAIDGKMTDRMPIYRVNVGIMQLLEEAEAAGATHEGVGEDKHQQGDQKKKKHHGKHHKG